MQCTILVMSRALLCLCGTAAAGATADAGVSEVGSCTAIGLARSRCGAQGLVACELITHSAVTRAGAHAALMPNQMATLLGIIM